MSMVASFRKIDKVTCDIFECVQSVQYLPLPETSSTKYILVAAILVGLHRRGALHICTGHYNCDLPMMIRLAGTL
jgi:hypothetical protein